MRRRYKAYGVVAVVTLVAALAAGTASAQTSSTTAKSSGSSSIVTGPNLSLNAKTLKLVQKDPLKGATATGLTRGVTSSQVKLGCYLQAAAFAGAEDAMRARFERANKKHELPGKRTINFTGCSDDGANPQTDLQIVQRLVQQDQVFAVLGISQSILPSSTDFLNNQQVPYFGWGFLPGFCGTRWGFGWNGCLVSDDKDLKHPTLQANLGEAPIKATGQSPSQVRAAFQAEDTDSGHLGNVDYTKIFQQVGAKVVYAQANMPVQTSDYTPYVRAVTAANPNVVLVSTSFTNVGGLSAALTAGGYKGLSVNFVGYLPGIIDKSAQLATALNGTSINNQTVPAEQNTAYVKQIQKDLQAIGKNTAINNNVSIGYAEADELVAMLKAAGKTLNTKTFDQAVNNPKKPFTYDSFSKGGPGSVQYPAHHQVPTDCSAMVKYTNPSGYSVEVPFTCYKTVVE
ncbi:MAG TPA: ABC transporter substrate-binding protein [Acidimicrobiia bacterium]|nr:ABC transporter substrate-binding protein [Acidimicrobiia bacterium]